MIMILFLTGLVNQSFGQVTLQDEKKIQQWYKDLKKKRQTLIDLREELKILYEELTDSREALVTSQELGNEDIRENPEEQTFIHVDYRKQIKNYLVRYKEYMARRGDYLNEKARFRAELKDYNTERMRIIENQ